MADRHRAFKNKSFDFSNEAFGIDAAVYHGLDQVDYHLSEEFQNNWTYRLSSLLFQPCDKVKTKKKIRFSVAFLCFYVQLLFLASQMWHASRGSAMARKHGGFAL